MIKVFINSVANTAFTVSGSTLTFTSAPANSAIIRIERQTPTDARLVDFTDGSVLTELPAKSHTFTIMANSDRISQQIIRRLNQ